MVRSLLSAKVVILNEHDNVLVLKRSETHPQKPHETDLPGGIIEKGEFELLGAAREVHEETGIILESDQCELFYADTSMPHPGVALTMLLYYVKFDSTPDVNISWEHESFDWVSIEQLLGCEDLEHPERRAIEFAVQNDLFSI